MWRLCWLHHCCTIIVLMNISLAVGSWSLVSLTCLCCIDAIVANPTKRPVGASTSAVCTCPWTPGHAPLSSLVAPAFSATACIATSRYTGMRLSRRSAHQNLEIKVMGQLGTFQMGHCLTGLDSYPSIFRHGTISYIHCSSFVLM